MFSSIAQMLESVEMMLMAEIGWTSEIFSVDEPDRDMCCLVSDVAMVGQNLLMASKALKEARMKSVVCAAEDYVGNKV